MKNETTKAPAQTRRQFVATTAAFGASSGLGVLPARAALDEATLVAAGKKEGRATI